METGKTVNEEDAIRSRLMNVRELVATHAGTWKILGLVVVRRVTVLFKALQMVVVTVSFVSARVKAKVSCTSAVALFCCSLIRRSASKKLSWASRAPASSIESSLCNAFSKIEKVC